MVEEDASVDLLAEDETIVGCIAYEPGNDCEGDWFVKAVATQRRVQQQGHATTLLRSVLERLAVVSPGGTVYWHVQVANHGSHKMSEGVDAERTQPPGYGELALYVVRLPENDHVGNDTDAGAHATPLRASR